MRTCVVVARRLVGATARAAAEAERQVLGIGSHAFWEDLDVQLTGQRTIGRQLSDQDFLVRTSHTVAHEVRGEPRTAEEAVHLEVLTCFEVSTPCVTCGQGQGHSGSAITHNRCRLDADGQPAVVLEFWEGPEEQGVDHVCSQTTERVLIEARARAEVRWVHLITGDGRHEVCFVRRGHIHTVCGRAKHTTFSVGLHREVETVLSTSCIGSA